mmetsp:Transcript_21907/g.43065  ORF Transcript_21907/g.43065 Transcript_21907/m.43065 type:complete len:112 (+) Transcript_21907:190-525(+)
MFALLFQCEEDLDSPRSSSSQIQRGLGVDLQKVAAGCSPSRSLWQAQSKVKRIRATASPFKIILCEDPEFVSVGSVGIHSPVMQCVRTLVRCDGGEVLTNPAWRPSSQTTQ